MKRKGMTLVEIVMTIVIGGIVFASLMKVFTNITDRSVNLELVGIGQMLVASKLEEVCGRSFDGVSSESLTAFGGDFTDFSSTLEVFNVSAEVLDVSLGATSTGYKLVRVKVSSNALPENEIELTTLITDASNE
jgi:prepilin-type N-terminal cleavage/methylation domain-containing protein